MKRFGVLIFMGLAVFFAAVAAAGAFPGKSQIGDNFVPGEIVVLTKESDLGDDELIAALLSSSPAPIRSIEKLHKYDLERSATPHGKRLFTLKFNEKINPHFVADSIKLNSLVLIAEPNYIGVGEMIPNDELFVPAQWGLDNTGQFGGTPDADIDAPEAWDMEIGSSSIIIAIIDTGADLDHEDLVAKILPSWDAVQNDFVPEDDHGHGTLSAGVAAASTNNGHGVAGTCPECMLLPVRAGFNNNGTAYFYAVDVFEALEFAVNNPGNIEGIPENPNVADVISMSFGSASPNAYFQRGVDDAYAAGAVLTAAAGNENTSNPRYPAAYDKVIAVAATDGNDARASFSNYGSWVDVAAPGVNIFTTYWNNDYSGPSGTSLSVPFVAGTIGLMLGKKNTHLNQELIRQILITSSDPVTGFPAIMGGRINAENALIKTPVSPPPRHTKLFYEQY